MDWSKLPNTAENYLKQFVTPMTTMDGIESTMEQPETEIMKVVGDNEYGLLNLSNSLINRSIANTQNYLEERVTNPLDELGSDITDHLNDVQSGLLGILNVFNIDLVGFVFALFIIQVLLCIAGVFLYIRITEKEGSVRKYVEQKVAQASVSRHFV